MHLTRKLGNRRSKGNGGMLLALAASVGGLASVAHAGLDTSVDASWNLGGNFTSPADWGTAGNWTTTDGTTLPPSGAGLYVQITSNITTANKTINLNGTRTVGRLDIGDSDDTNTFTIAPGTGGILNFDGNGSDAQLNQISTSKGDSITAPITLSSSLDITNASANPLTLVNTPTSSITSAATSGTQNLTFLSGTVAVGSSTAGTGVIGDGSTGGHIAVVVNGGTAALWGANTYSGGVTVQNGGTLLINNNSALGTGTLSVPANATAELASSGTAGSGYTVTNVLSIGNSATVNFGDPNGTTNKTRVIYGALAGGTASSIGAGAQLTFNAAVIFGANSNSTSGSAGETFGAGAVLTSSANNASTVIFRGPITLGGNISLTNNSTGSNADLQFGSDSGTYAIADASGVAGSLTINGGTKGVLLYGNANTYSGGTTLTGGWLELGQNNVLGTGPFYINGGTISPNSTSSYSYANNLVLGSNDTATLGASGVTGVVSFSGNATLQAGSQLIAAVSGSALGAGGSSSTITIAGSGVQFQPASGVTLTLGSPSSKWSDDNGSGGGYGLTMSGAGTLKLAGVGSGLKGAIAANSGTLDVNGTALTVAGLSGSGTVTNSGSNATLTITGTSQFNGILQDSGAGKTLALKNTGGTLTLTGANTYTGGTTVTGATLVAGYASSSSTASSTGTGSVTLNGGTLASASGSTSYVLGAVAGGSGANTISPGGSGTVGTLDLGGSLTLNSSSTLNLDVNGNSADALNIAGAFSGSPTLVLNCQNPVGDYTLITAGSGLLSVALPAAPSGYAWEQTGTTIALQTVPEPTVAGLLAVGAVGLLAGRKRRAATRPA